MTGQVWAHITLSSHSIFFMFGMKLASKDSNAVGTCEDEVKEETLRSVEDFDGWSSSLPSDHADTTIANLVCAVKAILWNRKFKMGPLTRPTSSPLVTPAVTWMNGLSSCAFSSRPWKLAA